MIKKVYNFVVYVEGNIIKEYQKKCNCFELENELIQLNRSYFGDVSITYGEV